MHINEGTSYTGIHYESGAKAFAAIYKTARRLIAKCESEDDAWEWDVPLDAVVGFLEETKTANNALFMMALRLRDRASHRASEIRYRDDKASTDEKKGPRFPVVDAADRDVAKENVLTVSVAISWSGNEDVLRQARSGDREAIARIMARNYQEAAPANLLAGDIAYAKRRLRKFSEFCENTSPVTAALSVTPSEFHEVREHFLHIDLWLDLFTYFLPRQVIPIDPNKVW